MGEKHACAKSKNCVFISGQNMWSKWNFDVFLKKLKSPEIRLFQGFFEDFEGEIFGLVNAVSRIDMQRFFGGFRVILGAFVSRNGAFGCSC